MPDRAALLAHPAHDGRLSRTATWLLQSQGAAFAAVPFVFKLAKTVIEGVVLLIAAYAFAFVPLGQHTALHHLRAIWGTKEAQEASRELKQAGGRVMDELLKSGSAAGSPRLPPLEPAHSKIARQLDGDAGTSEHSSPEE